MSVGDFSCVLQKIEEPGNEFRLRAHTSLENHEVSTLNNQAPPFFSRALQKIGEPGDEVIQRLALSPGLLFATQYL